MSTSRARLVEKMKSGSRKSALPSQTKDDIDVDELARQFFRTDLDNNLRKPQEKHHRRPKDKNTNSSRELIPATQKEETLNNHTPRGFHLDLNHEFSERNSKVINDLKDKRDTGSVRKVPKDFKQVILTRFVELRDEFYSLSERLESVNMPKISKRLTQVLAERQRLMAVLLEMGEPSYSVSSYSDDEKEYERFQNQSRDSKQGDFGMPKKSKSVHWSDECLGGSIIQYPTFTVREPVKHATLEAQTDSKTRNSPEYSEDCEVSSQLSPRRQLRQHEVKMPPPYKMVDNFTQTRRRRKIRSQCDTQGNLCSFEIGHVLGCINEAAVLRHEACCMLWRAHYLEQLRDVDRTLNLATSGVPSLPRYPQLQQNNR